MKYLCAFFYPHLALLQYFYYQMAMWGESTGPESLNTHSKRTENLQFSWLLYSYSWGWHRLGFREHRKLEKNSSVSKLLNCKQIVSKCRTDLEIQTCSFEVNWNCSRCRRSSKVFTCSELKSISWLMPIKERVCSHRMHLSHIFNLSDVWTLKNSVRRWNLNWFC